MTRKCRRKCADAAKINKNERKDKRNSNKSNKTTPTMKRSPHSGKWVPSAY